MHQVHEEASAPTWAWVRAMYRRAGLLALSFRSYSAVSHRYLLTLLAGLVCLRSWVFLWYPHAHLDSDQAVFGLMAKDLALGRDFPLFTYGRRYMLAVGAWLCAPLIALFGLSITTLKLPMFAMNVGCVVMLWVALRRERGVGPWGATLAILPFAAASVVVASRLVEHAGGNIEPLFFLLLAYLLRNRSVWLGLVFGIAFLNREFAPIGLIALVIMDVLQGSWRPRVRLYAIVLAVAAAVVVFVRLLAPYSANYYGPFGTGDPQPFWNGEGTAAFIHGQLPLLLGAARVKLQNFIECPLYAGKDWLGYLIIPWAMLGVAGTLKLTRADLGGISTYLILCGLGQTAAFILLSGSQWNPMNIRYVLLTLWLWVGLTANAWKTPALRPWIAVIVLTFAGVNVRDHIRVARQYIRSPPTSDNQRIAEALLQRQVRYANADFWIAYTTAFLTDERVMISPTRGKGERITRYINELVHHKHEIVYIQEEPCSPGKSGDKVMRWRFCRRKPK